MYPRMGRSWALIGRLLKNDFGSDAFLRQDLEENGVGHASVDDMRLLRPTPERPHRRFDLRQHAAVDHVVPDQALRLALGQRRHVLAGAVLDPLHVGEVDQLLGEQRSGHVARHEIGVDVVRLPVGADADGGDHGYEAAVLEHADRLGVDRLDLADEPDVGHGPVGLPVQPLARTDQGAVLAAEPDRPAAVEVDQADDLFVDLADQHHLHDLHRLGVGHAHPAHEVRILAQPLHEGADLRATAMDDDGPHADQPQQEHVPGELLLEIGLLHGRPAVLDDQRLALEGADVRQRLEQHLRPLDHGPRVRVHHVYLKDEAGKVLIFEDRGQVGAHVVGVDLDLLAAHLRRGEGDLFQELLHHRVEPPGSDVLGALVDRGGDLGHLLDRVLSERQRHALGLQQLHVLANKGVFGFAQNADKIAPRQGLELDPDREAALELGDEIRGFRHVKGAGGDEQDVVRPDHAVLRGHRRALDDRQEVALDPLPRDVGPVGAFPARDLVELVEEDYAGVLHPANGLAHRFVHVDQLLRLLLGEESPRLGHLEPPPPRLAGHEVREHVLDVHANLFHALAREDLEHRPGLRLHVQLDHALVELARSQLGPELVAGRIPRSVG